MPTYHLSDFQTWLNSTSYKHLPHWADYFQLISSWGGTIDDSAFFAHLINGGGEIEKEEIQHQYQAILNEWKQVIDREQEPNPTPIQDLLKLKLPSKQSRQKVVRLDISSDPTGGFFWSDLANDLPKFVVTCPSVTGELDLTDFPNLQALYIGLSGITKINLANCPNLLFLNCSECNIQDLDLSHNLELVEISIYPGSAPLKTLAEKIQNKERELASLRAREQQEQISKLETELQALKELKARLEANAQERASELIRELEEIKQQKQALATQFQNQASSLTNTCQQLDLLKTEFTKQEQELSKLKDKLASAENKSDKLEQQLAALAVSSGLLSQQVEQLTNQLSEAEQKEERSRLEAEIQSNLVREQGGKINQQEGQISNYQQLLRKSEENLKKAQDLINQKSEQLEKLEREKELIAEELELANGKIKELEQALVSSQSKIGQLEARIKDLESKGNNSAELERLKKELAAEKQKNQIEKTKQSQEIKRLQQELKQTKLREEELATKLKELGTKKIKTQANQETKSFWQTIKTPLLYLGGGIIILLGLGWLWSKLSD